MKQEIRDEWVNALESGEYKQTDMRLRDDEGKMCCLGVLCDLAAKAGVGEWRDVDGDWYFGSAAEFKALEGDGGDGYLPDAGVPPKSVRDWSGIPYAAMVKTSDPALALISGAGTGRIHLTTLNDRARYSFNQIAAEIRKQDPIA
jgi:hypothetical protein